MKENGAAFSGDWRLGVVADFDEPVICEIAKPHALLVIPRRGILEVYCDVAIVVGMRDIV